MCSIQKYYLESIKNRFGITFSQPKNPSVLENIHVEVNIRESPTTENDIARTKITGKLPTGKLSTRNMCRSSHVSGECGNIAGITYDTHHCGHTLY